MLATWLDRDDITADELEEMTAEEEVLDWIVGSPVPAARRPDWLPEASWAEPEARRLPSAPRARPPMWPLVVAALVAAGGLGLFAGAMGLAAAVWWLG